MITPVKDGGWDEEDELKSDEMNAFQERLLKALDGVDGGTYEIANDLVFDGDGAVVIENELVIADGATINIEGDLDIEDGANIHIRDGGKLVVHTGGQIDVGGELIVQDTGVAIIDTELRVRLGADLILEDGGDLLVEANGEIALASGGMLNVGNGGDINLGSGGDINAGNGSHINVTGTGQLVVGASAVAQMADANRLTIDASPFTAHLCMTPITTPSGWSFGTSGSTFGWDMAAASGEKIIFGLPFRPGDTLLTVTMRLEGDAAGGGGHSGLPADMPLLEVIRKDVTTGVFTVVDSQADGVLSTPSVTNNTTYDAAHEVTVSLGPGHSYVSNAVYYVRITAEGGANADAGSTRVYSIRFTGLARSYRGSIEIYA